MPRWTAPDASLTATEDVVIAEIPDERGRSLTHAIAPRSFLSGTWQATLVTWLGPAVIAEARAWLVERNQPLNQRPKPVALGRLGERPWVARSGGNERRGWVLRGRVAEVRGPGWLRTMSIDAIAAAGLPADHPLSEADELLLIQAAKALLPFACSCGTGPHSPEEHGTLKVLSEVKEGEALGVVGRCQQCGRAWTFGAEAVGVRASFDGEW